MTPRSPDTDTGSPSIPWRTVHLRKDLHAGDHVYRLEEDDKNPALWSLDLLQDAMRVLRPLFMLTRKDEVFHHVPDVAEPTPLLITDLPLDVMKPLRACAIVAPRSKPPWEGTDADWKLDTTAKVPDLSNTWMLARWPVTPRRRE